MRRLDALAALLAVLAVAFLACSPDPLDEAVPHSGGTSTTAPPPSAAPGAECAPDGSWCISATSTVVTTSTTAPTTTTTAAPETTAAPSTTTTVPATTAPPPTTAAARAGGCAGWRDLIAAHFPAAQVAKACAVMLCESEGNPNAISPPGRYGSDFGLMQINEHYNPEFFAAHDPLDPTANVAFAADLWSRRGWGAWTCA